MTTAPSAQACIVFAHANGFPARTYRVLLEAWRAAGFQVLAPEKFGHDPLFPVRSNWRPTRDELIHFIETQAPLARVHLIGHSLGGYVSLLVASHRPELVASVVLLDSPIVTGWKARAVQFSKLTGLVRRVTPGKVSRTRRQHWPRRAARCRRPRRIDRPAGMVARRCAPFRVGPNRLVEPLPVARRPDARSHRTDGGRVRRSRLDLRALLVRVRR